ncbi:MAG: response regulator transcription factor [Actinobacteria bacterium]|nr:response regulator transcription factor [Actinomycetota bacterium]
MRVLIVEDEERLAETIARGLRREGMAVDTVLDGVSALEKLGVNEYDAVVLDRNLPGVHGDQVCRVLAARAKRPAVLMLTAAGAVDDRVEGLNLGADDYLPKPFAFAELVARLRALGRRPGWVLPPVLRLGGIELDPGSHTVMRNGRPIELTRKEFAILEVLLTAEGVVTAEDLLERAWDENANPFTNSVRVTIMTLRRKLGEPQPIQTVTGVGYRLCDD